MNRTFASEDKRKTKLFEGWIEYLTKIHFQFEENEFEEIYEGVAVVSDLSKSRIGFHLENGKKIRHIPISQEISCDSSRLDSMYIVLGLKNGKWWPLDVISIGSIIPGKPDIGHITYNPLYMNHMSQSHSKH